MDETPGTCMDSFFQRAAEKQKQRDQDEQDISSGLKTREQVQRKNAFIRAEFGLIIDLKNAPVAG